MIDPWQQPTMGSALSGIAQPEPWVDEALCSQTDAELFFPDAYDRSNDARRICASCPVTKECLDYAIRMKEPAGIWGGKSTPERRRLERTNRGAKKCRMCSAMFDPKTANVQLCSDDCRQRGRRERRRTG